METAKVGKNLQIRRQSLKHSLEAAFAFNVHDGKRASRTNCDAANDNQLFLPLRDPL